LRIVFVVGLYDTVREELQKRYAAQLGAGTLIFIRQTSGNPIPDLRDFNSRISDVAKRCASIRVLLAVLTGYEWVEAKVHQILDRVGSHNPRVEICVSAPPRREVGIGIVGELIDEIEAFGLDPPDAVTVPILEGVLGDSRVLCLSLAGKAGFGEALTRAGFPPESIGRFFVERSISPGRNSNLMAIIIQDSKHCDHLLYAYDGLRTLKADVKKKFSGKAYEAVTTARVIEVFRKWILGEWANITHRGDG
jgi:hypothetical protein